MKKNIVIMILMFVSIILVLNLTINKKNYLIDISLVEIQEKLENKDNFVLLIEKEGCPACIKLMEVLEKEIYYQKKNNL